MSYIDGFVLAVPTANRDAYRKMAEEAAGSFKDLGALAVMEAWGEDVPEGKVNSFNSAVMRKEDETVVFSWVVWPDKATREAAWKKMQETMPMPAEMPFDGKRMIYGGFEPLVDR